MSGAAGRSGADFVRTMWGKEEQGSGADVRHSRTEQSGLCDDADRIRELEREAGRYCKKILDQGRELESLRREAEELRAGSGEVQRAVDALLTAVTLRYGEREKELGWRLEVPGVHVEDLLGRYEIHARRGDEGYVIGVSEKGGEAGSEGDSDRAERNSGEGQSHSEGFCEDGGAISPNDLPGSEPDSEREAM